jgi:hypothetical protein
VVGGRSEGVAGTGLGAYPSTNHGIRAVLGHSQSSEGEGSTIKGNANCCRTPYRDVVRHTEMVEQLATI